LHQSVALFVCLSVCEQDYAKSFPRIFMKPRMGLLASIMGSTWG